MNQIVQRHASQEDLLVALLQSRSGRTIISNKIENGECNLETVVYAIFKAINLTRIFKGFSTHLRTKSHFTDVDAENFILCLLSVKDCQPTARNTRQILIQNRKFPHLILAITSYIVKDELDFFHSISLRDTGSFSVDITLPHIHYSQTVSKQRPSFLEWLIQHIRKVQKDVLRYPPQSIDLMSGYQLLWDRHKHLPSLHSILSYLASRMYFLIAELNKKVLQGIIKDSSVTWLRNKFSFTNLYATQWQALRVFAVILFLLIGNENQSGFTLSSDDAVMILKLLGQDGIFSCITKKDYPDNCSHVARGVICISLLVAANISPTSALAKLAPAESFESTRDKDLSNKVLTAFGNKTNLIKEVIVLTQRLVTACIPSCEVLHAALLHVYSENPTRVCSLRALIQCNLHWPKWLAISTLFVKEANLEAYSLAVRKHVSPIQICQRMYLRQFPVRDSPGTGMSLSCL